MPMKFRFINYTSKIAHKVECDSHEDLFNAHAMALRQIVVSIMYNKGITDKVFFCIKLAL